MKLVCIFRLLTKKYLRSTEHKKGDLFLEMGNQFRRRQILDAQVLPFLLSREGMYQY